MLPENFKLESFMDTSKVIANKKLVRNIASCYKEIFNSPPWRESWTQKSAETQIKETLKPRSDRTPLLTLLFEEKRVIGFLWIILTTAESITLNDMPYDLSNEEKQIGLKTTRYWLEKNHHKKIVIFREVGLLEEYRRINEFRVASYMIPPIIKEAYRRKYKLLFYWTKMNNAVYEIGLGFGWHPIHFYPDHNIVILKGGISNFIYCLEGIQQDSREVFSKMEEARRIYQCT